MKTLDVNEMEKIEGGIACEDVLHVVVYVDVILGNHAQAEAMWNLITGGGFQCT